MCGALVEELHNDGWKPRRIENVSHLSVDQVKEGPERRVLREWAYINVRELVKHVRAKHTPGTFPSPMVVELSADGVRESENGARTFKVRPMFSQRRNRHKREYKM